MNNVKHLPEVSFFVDGLFENDESTNELTLKGVVKVNKKKCVGLVDTCFIIGIFCYKKVVCI